MDHKTDTKWRYLMNIIKSLILTMSLIGAAVVIGCSSPEPTATPLPTATAVPTATPVPPTAKLLYLSNDSPHITVIDAETNLVVETADVPEFTKWTWNDDNNYFDGKNVWLGMKYPEGDDAVVIALDVDTDYNSVHICGYCYVDWFKVNLNAKEENVQ